MVTQTTAAAEAVGHGCCTGVVVPVPLILSFTQVGRATLLW